MEDLVFLFVCLFVFSAVLIKITALCLNVFMY